MVDEKLMLKGGGNDDGRGVLHLFLIIFFRSHETIVFKRNYAMLFFTATTTLTKVKCWVSHVYI